MLKTTLELSRGEEMIERDNGIRLSPDIDAVHSLLSVFSPLFLLYQQLKKAELYKAVQDKRISMNPEVNGLYAVISQLEKPESKKSYDSTIIIDMKVRVLVSSLNDRTSSLWCYRDDKTGFLNALCLYRDAMQLIALLPIVRNQLQMPTLDLIGQSCLDLISSCETRILPAILQRIDYYVQHFTEAIVTKAISGMIHRYPDYFNPIPSSVVWWMGCSCGRSFPKAEIPSSSGLAEELQQITILSFDEAICKFAESNTFSNSLEVNHLKSIVFEHSLTAILESFLSHRIQMNEDGIQKFYQVLLIYQQAIQHEKKLRNAETVLEHKQVWCKAAEVLRILTAALYSSVDSSPSSNSPSKKEMKAFTSSSETVNGSFLSEEEKRLWRLLVRVRSSSSILSRMWKWRRKQKGVVFISLELDYNS